MMYKIVETDNFGGDYPDEKFVNLPFGTKERMQRIADAINNEFCKDDYASRYWKVVDQNYKLQPGFEP
jgi:hypothetical protein